MKKEFDSYTLSGACALNDKILAEAWTLLFGPKWKRDWRDRDKANEMRTIIEGHDIPCRPFMNYVECINFLSRHCNMPKYSRTEFDGYTHRFKVQFDTGEPYSANLDIYSNSNSHQKLEEFINENKTDKVLSFKIINRSSKEQDEKMAELIDETLKDI